MKKYDLNLLKDFLLNNSDRERIVLSQNDIEKIVGGKLPEFHMTGKLKIGFGIITTAIINLMHQTGWMLVLLLLVI